MVCNADDGVEMKPVCSPLKLIFFLTSLNIINLASNKDT